MPETDGFTLAGRLKRNRVLSKTKIIMLTSAAEGTDAERCRKIRAAAHLNKPVKQSELLDAIATIFARRKRLKEKQAPVSTGDFSSPLRVLVAEDNPVNQALMLGLLKRQGHEVKVAANGSAAIEALARDSFDVILMDIQMPVMGGLQATVAIREKEQGSGRRIPIIGTSAHAMASDRDRAIEAGMDAYLVKPIRPGELYETMNRLTGRKPDAEIDEQSLLDGVGGSRSILRKLVTVFLKDSTRMIREIRKAAAARNGELIATASHALKGSSGNFGRNAVFETARQLEQAGKAGRIDEAPVLLKRLERDLAVLRKRLERLRK
jgi:CheY-like chemotaxis protein